MSSVLAAQLAEEVHAGGVRLVIAVTGGGSQAISALLTTPGASRSILAATVPYAAEALVEWIGAEPEEYCSAATARAMAMAAYLKARKYAPGAVTCGVACTASLASDRPKRGGHRAHFAWQSATTTATLEIRLAKGHRTRAEEEAVVAAALLNLIAEACGAASRVAVPLIENEQFESQHVVAPQEQQDLLVGRSDCIPHHAIADPNRPRALFPGAFNPLHEGHKTMAAVATQVLGCPVAYEISIVNVDKPPLDFIDIEQRTRLFAAHDEVWLSRAPRFSEKARLFPGATFVVGADTIERIGQPRYYGGDVGAMNESLAAIAAAGCRFLVFGRVAAAGKFRQLADLDLPKTLAEICQEVPESVFRHDVSSTKLRAKNHGE
jgi:nicotinamide mononucleotide (NMN) deamidase PncC